MAFSLELTEEQRTIQKWLHEFAEGVMRPVASEWDEREETPWPVIQEAAKVGIYSLDFFSQAALGEASRDSVSRWSWRSSSGVTPGSAWRSAAPRSPSRPSPATAPPSR